MSSFIANEEQNFSLYTYVNEQADEVELLEGQVQELQEEEAKQDGIGINQYEQVLQDMDVKMKATREQTAKLEQKCDEAQRTAESIKDAIKVSNKSRSGYCTIKIAITCMYVFIALAPP